MLKKIRIFDNYSLDLLTSFLLTSHLTLEEGETVIKKSVRFKEKAEKRLYRYNFLFGLRWHYKENSFHLLWP